MTQLKELLAPIKARLSAADPNLCKGEKPRGECHYFGDSLIQLSHLYENWEEDVELFWHAPTDLTKLIAALEAYDEALAYYANEMSYSIDDYAGISGEMRKRCVLYGDVEERNDFYSYAGQRARNARARVSEILGGEGE